MIHQKKSRGHRTSKIVKSRQSSGNGHLPYHLFILWVSARADGWRGMWIRVRSKDAQKQLARTSLNWGILTSYTLHLTPYTLHLTPYTLHLTPYTLHLTPYTLHLTPYTLHLTPYTLHLTPYTLHLTPYTLHLTPYTLHLTPYTLHLTPYTLHFSMPIENFFAYAILRAALFSAASPAEGLGSLAIICTLLTKVFLN